MTIETICQHIVPASQSAMELAQKRWNSIAKPLGSLGLLEVEIIRMAGMFGTAQIPVLKPAVIAMCADNGVVAEGVTQTGQEVTAIVTENMSSRDTSVCRMARRAGATVFPVDIGVAVPLQGEHILQKNIRRGTGNIAIEPAMTRQEAEAAILVGIELVGDLKAQGYNLIATGEMGIGNTTTSAAIAAVLLGIEPQVVTGRGAGLSDQGLVRKIDAITRAIAVNQPDPSDAIDVVSKVGGLDLAGLAGVFLGGAYHHIPVLVDGVISMAAALVAAEICPTAKDYMVGSHASAEPAGALFVDALGLKPFLFAGMRLGEGTGAVAVMPILDMALAVYDEMSTFDDIEIEAYQENPQ
ncbi:nicotinate-nucleotide--dimethylbenzimidazole phosphoribosyltransferase [Bengtsoniella intestinalis]|uniref:nicotinate-nucleotide--dimethylbenzimidazole phosphoribosyltransferase n=1 Tax=Bengtsoniella intestinalis TaxID=3073143 RepID=UPI00391FA52F